MKFNDNDKRKSIDKAHLPKFISIFAWLCDSFTHTHSHCYFSFSFFFSLSLNLFLPSSLHTLCHILFNCIVLLLFCLIFISFCATKLFSKRINFPFFSLLKTRIFVYPWLNHIIASISLKCIVILLHWILGFGS